MTIPVGTIVNGFKVLEVPPQRTSRREQLYRTVCLGCGTERMRRATNILRNTFCVRCACKRIVRRDGRLVKPRVSKEFRPGEIVGGYRIAYRDQGSRCGQILYLVTCVRCGAMAIRGSVDLRRNKHGCQRCAAARRERAKGKFIREPTP